MFETSETLLEYDNPVLVKTTESKSAQTVRADRSKQLSGKLKGGGIAVLVNQRWRHPGHVTVKEKICTRDIELLARCPPRVSPGQISEFTPSPHPKAKSPYAEPATEEHEEVLDFILPPRTWQEGNKLWIQKVSRTPCTRADIINLRELLDKKLQEKEARPMGLCPIRRELYTQCFDELIRQVTIICPERGLLLLRVRDEIKMTIDAYQTLYESGIAFGMRKALLADQGMDNMIQRISDLENEKRDLVRQLNEQKAMCDAIEKRETEKMQLEKKKYNQETELLMKANQQLKSQLEGIIMSKK